MKPSMRTALFWLFIAVLATILWEMVAHWSNPILLVFIVVLAFIGLPVGIGLATNFTTKRAERKRLAKLAYLFDSGTAETQSAALGIDASMSGKFHGRQAWISIGRVAPGPNIRISLAGDFGVLFQVRARKISKAGATRFVSWAVLLGMWLWLDLKAGKKPGESVWSLNAIMFTSLCVFELIQRARNYRRFGKSEFYKHSRTPVSFPGSEFLEFSSVTPDVFSAMIERREIQDAVSRLIESCQIDLLSVIYQHRLETSMFQTANAIEANFYYRKQWLEPDHVQAVLLGLLALCQNLEAAR